MSWFADNDGDPEGAPAVFTDRSPTGVMGVRILQRPTGGCHSHNWWAFQNATPGFIYVNWGPRHRINQGGFYGSLGYPKGDRSIYKMMRNCEIDFDQVRTALGDYVDEGWSDPPQEEIAKDIATGINIYSLLSVGPLDPIPPGDSIQFTVAFIAGADFHRYPDNFARNFDPYNPQPYIDRLDFSDLIKNARWAAWVFDNPGVDTDGDGYRGEAHLINCVDGRCDSVFYTGDGVPDWRGPGPPESSPFELTSGERWITLRWSGEFSELQVDPLSGQRDFEGFRVYTGRFERDDQYSLIASWDVEDFKRFAWIPKEGKWLQISHPATIPVWRRMLNDPEFHPGDYTTPSFELAYRDTVLDTVLSATGQIIRIDQRERYSYWVREDYNRGNEYDDNGQWVQNAIQRVAVRDTIVGEDTLSYGVYEVTIDNLNPAVPLYFAVTAFDFGNYEVDLEPLESSPSNNSQYAHPIYSTDVVVDSGLRVSVYPNPYKVVYDGGDGERTTYYREGYEGRGIYQFEEQDRRIWFVNLPVKATIRIFSLDGDLIRTINHPDPFLTKYPSAVGWDLVSRNIQAVTSGIYIWRVDSELGTQTGKLVIIK
ncbi:MAG: T9SS type A sorting domain-containing protein [Candidatus Zixiibacteriota bacterium]